MRGFCNADRVYYRCVGFVMHRTSKNRVCRNRSLRGNNLQAAIWADVSALLTEPKRIAEEYERRLNVDDDPTKAPSNRKLQMPTNRVPRQISKLIDAYA